MQIILVKNEMRRQKSSIIEATVEKKKESNEKEKERYQKDMNKMAGKEGIRRERRIKRIELN